MMMLMIYIYYDELYVCLSVTKIDHFRAEPGGAKQDTRFGLVMMMMMLLMMMMAMMMLIMMMMIMRMMTQPALTEAVASLLKRNALPGRAPEPVVVARLHLKS